MANVIEFTLKGVDKASGPLGKISGGLGSMIKVSAAAAAAVAGTAAAVIAFTAKINAGIDSTSKFSQRIGETTGKVMELHHAANLAGVGQESFNNMTLQLNKNMGEAARGMGRARGEFVKLGLDAKELSRLPLDDQLNAIAKSMEGIEDPTQRNTIAMRMFGGEGSKMLLLLQSDMQAAAADARFLGITVSQQTAANAEAFTDAMSRSTGALKGVSMAIAAEITPALTGMLNKAADFIASNRQAIVDFVTGAIENIITFGVIVSQVFGKVHDFIKNVFSKKGFEDFIAGGKAALQWLGNAFIEIGPVLIRTMYSSFKVIWESFFELGKWAWNNVKAFFSGAETVSIADLLFDNIPKATEESRAELAKLWDDLGGMAKEKGGEISSALVETFGISIELAREQARELIGSYEQFGTVAEEVNRGVLDSQVTFFEAFNEANNEFLSTQKEMVEQFAFDLHALMITTVDSVSNAIGESIVMGADLMKALENIAKQAVAQVISMLVKMGIQRMLTSAISGAAIAKESSMELSKGAASTFMNAYSSTAAIPVIGPAMAPGVAAAALAGATSGSAMAAAAGASLGASLIGVAHSGMDFVPREGTYLLDRGERVLSPGQNEDLNRFMQGSGGEGIRIDSMEIHVLENATNVDSLMSMDDADIERLVSDKILAAMNRLGRIGIRPDYIDRGGA